MGEVHKEILKEARHKLPVLINVKGSTILNQVRQSLQNGGFHEIRTVSSHVNAIVDLKENKSQLIFFSAETPEGAEVTAEQFVEYAQKLVKNPILIALASEPDGEALFSLLKAGATAFLIPPFTTAALEGAVQQVQDGVEFSEDLLNAEDRNAAFAEIIREQLDRCANNVKKVTEVITEDELELHLSSFDQMVKTARFFCKDGQDKLMTSICDHFEQHAKNMDIMFNKTRLRNTREMLRKKRQRVSGSK